MVGSSNELLNKPSFHFGMFQIDGAHHTSLCTKCKTRLKLIIIQSFPHFDVHERLTRTILWNEDIHDIIEILIPNPFSQCASPKLKF